MQKPRQIKDLLLGVHRADPGDQGGVQGGGHTRLSALRARSAARSGVLAEVRAALPQRLAEQVASAGLEQGRLTLGVTGAVWAARLRYEAEGLRKAVGGSLKTAILTVRIRVLPAPP